MAVKKYELRLTAYDNSDYQGKPLYSETIGIYRYDHELHADMTGFRDIYLMIELTQTTKRHNAASTLGPRIEKFMAKAMNQLNDTKTNQISLL